MQYSTISGKTVDERNALALSLVEDMTPMLHRYASALAGRVDFDELYQDAFLKILRILEERGELVGCVSFRKYVAVSIEHQIVDKIRYLKVRRGTVSLDEPLLEEVSLTLADVLPSPYSAEPVRIVLVKERLEELQKVVSSRKHPGTRRMLTEMYATVQAQTTEC